MDAYSVVITSCGRFYLLRATLRSLPPNPDPAPEKIVVVEDSEDHGIRDVVGRLDINFETK